MINTYEELANIIMDAFTNENLESNIIVGTTFNIKWEDVVTSDNVVYGVLLPMGGASIKVEKGLLKTENFSLALALPDNVPNQYFNALESVKNAIKNFIVVPHEIAGDTYIFGDNGLQAIDFRVVKGKHIGVVTQNLISQVAGNMLDVSDAIVKIVAYDSENPNSDDDGNFLFGMYHYTFGKVKNFDPIDLKKEEIQKLSYRSKSLTLTLDYYKIKENVLHKLLLADNKPYYLISVNDGEDDLLEDYPMYLTGYTQDGIVGGYTNVKVTFSSGVITNNS